MKRRDFLHLAVAAAGATQARPLFATGQQAGPIGANNRIRTAIIGCGGRGRAVMREWIEHADTTFVAACDVDKARTDATVAELGTAGHTAQGYEDYRRSRSPRGNTSAISSIPSSRARSRTATWRPALPPRSHACSPMWPSGRTGR